MILGSTNISTLKLGSSAVQKVMLGATEVWSNFDPDFAAYLAVGIVNGSTMGAANQTAVNAFIVGCKADGIWSAIKASCLLCAWDSLAGALTPLVGTAPTNVNFVNGDYSRTTGLIGNGSTKYLNSNRNNNADPQDSFSACIFSNSLDANNLIGRGSNGVGTTFLSQTSSRCRTSGAATFSSTTGFIGISRGSSANYTLRHSGGSSTQSATSQSPLSGNIYIFAQTNNTANSVNPIAYSNSRISFYSIGEALDLALLDARLTTLMAALT